MRNEVIVKILSCLKNKTLFPKKVNLQHFAYLNFEV